MNEQWQKAIRHRNKHWKQFIRECTNTNNTIYKVQRNKCTLLRCKVIKDYFLEKTKAGNPRESVWNAYHPFMHSRKTKQASDILLQENDTVISHKQQIVDIFNDHFFHIANGAPEINVHDFGEDFTEHPSVIAIQHNNRERSSFNFFNFEYTNKTKVQRLLSSVNT